MADAQDNSDDFYELAYAAIDRGALRDASRHFSELLAQAPDNRAYHYMRGLAHKYLLDWPTSLDHNLRAIALSDDAREAEQWNAAIAATALGDWAQARALWSVCGVFVPEGEGPIVDDYGLAVVRLNPWAGGETVWARRIDPVRAQLLNVPLPGSGHRFGDIVLHDGASTGWRWNDDRKVNVFNELQRLEPSEFITHVAFVRCNRSDDLQPLLEATVPGLGYIEDWTTSVHHYCLRCSYGMPHRHDAGAVNDDWSPDRNLGIAAQSRRSVEQVLESWRVGGEGREVEGVEVREVPTPEVVEGHVWWREPEVEEDALDSGAS